MKLHQIAESISPTLNPQLLASIESALQADRQNYDSTDQWIEATYDYPSATLKALYDSIPPQLADAYWERIDQMMNSIE